MRAIPAWHSAAERVLPVAAGSVYGLALARFLFELDPARWTLFNTWLGALALAALGAALVLIFSVRWPRLRPATVALALPLLSLLAPDVNLLRAQTLLLGALALALLLNLESWNLNLIFWDVSLGLLLFALYLRTLAPAVGQADTFEFQVGIARLGIAHGSGYPLLMLVGKLFTLLPVGGTLAFRANLTSAFFGALAAVGVARLARQLGASALIAGIAGLAFGVSPTLWSRAVEVEAYTLNAALVVILLNLLVQLTANSQQPITSSGQQSVNRPSPTANRLTPWALYLIPFLFGLSLTNHLTTLLLAPACLAAVSRQRSVVSRQLICHWALVILSFLVGFSIYLYLPLRWPAVNHGEMLSWAQFTNILTGNEAKGALQWRLPFTDIGRYAIVFRKLVTEYGWAGLALAVVGAGKLVVSRQSSVVSGRPALVSRHWSAVIGHSSFIILFLTYLGYLYFALAFNVPDPDFSAFLIPLHLLAAVLMGVGVQTILNAQFSRLKAQSIEPYALCLVPCAFALLPFSSVWQTLPRVDHSGEWADDRAGRFMLAQPLAQNAAILADSKKIAPLYYLQVAEGVRPDLDIIVLPDEASYRAVLDERVAAGQTVYLGRYLPGLGGGYFLRSVGPLAEVSVTPFQAESTTIPFRLSAALAEGIRLIGYAAETEARAAASFPVTLFWQAPMPPQKHWLVYLRLVDATGAVVWQSAGRVPVSDLYPTNAWRAGEVVSDYYSVPLAETLAPGAYRLQAGLFPPFAPDDAGWAEVLPLTVLPAQQPPRIAHPVRMRLGAEWLMGYDAPETAAPGSRAKITYLWQNDAGLRLTASTLTMPTSGDSFLLTAQHAERAQCGWLAPPTDGCALALIRLTGAAIAEGAINFDNQLLLRRVALDTPQAAPGSVVEVTLEWQGLRAMAEDYTVFVHLIGPDGVVHGQVDAWPVSGTRATSTWAPGDIISDHYRIAVPEDAPPGAYQAEVGLYLLATFERLPVLNAEGAPVDDRVLEGGLRIGK